MQRYCKLILSALTGLAVTVAALVAGAGLANAQQFSAPAAPAPLPPPPVYSAPPPLAPAQAPPPPSFLSGLQLIAYPYFWLANLNMAITTPLARAASECQYRQR